MNRIVLARALALALAVAGSPASAQTVSWNHDPASGLGTNVWGQLTFPFATCGAVLPVACGALPDPRGAFTQVGKKQSPIDIVTAAAQPASLPALGFLYGFTPFEVENTGHVIEVPYADGAATLLVGADAYKLVQFHFHTPSEHSVDGAQGEMEVHLVHSNVVGDLAVVGIILRVGPNPNPLIERIFANAPASPGAVELDGQIDALGLLPRGAALSYWTYSGSLTTPPCSEGVRWIVVKNPVNVSLATVARMRQIVSLFPGYGGFDANSRPVRPLNGRVVLSR